MINLKTNDQKQISTPQKNELDKDPHAVGSYLTWFRKTAEDYQSNVWIKDGLDGQERLWLKNVDSAPVFYTR